MKRNKLWVTSTALMLLSGCAQGFTAEDRALLHETKMMVQEISVSSAKSANEAALARQHAEKAAHDAAMAAEKSNRIFQHGTDK